MPLHCKYMQAYIHLAQSFIFIHSFICAQIEHEILSQTLSVTDCFWFVSWAQSLGLSLSFLTLLLGIHEPKDSDYPDL